MPRGNPKGTNNGGGRKKGEKLKTYEVRPNGDVWSCCSTRCFKLKPTKDKKDMSAFVLADAILKYIY